MSTKAQAVLDQFKALPPHEQAAVRNELASLADDRERAWQDELVKLRAIQARNKGRGLLKELLKSRAEDKSLEQRIP